MCVFFNCLFITVLYIIQRDKKIGHFNTEGVSHTHRNAKSQVYGIVKQYNFLSLFQLHKCTIPYKVIKQRETSKNLHHNIKCSILRISVTVERNCERVGGDMDSQHLGMTHFAASKRKYINLPEGLEMPEKGKSNR